MLPRVVKNQEQVIQRMGTTYEKAVQNYHESVAADAERVFIFIRGSCKPYFYSAAGFLDGHAMFGDSSRDSGSER